MVKIELMTNKENANLTYAWSPNVSDNALAEGLKKGNYQVSVMDENGCMDAISLTIEAIYDASQATDSTK